MHQSLRKINREYNLKEIDIKEWEVLCPGCDGEAYFRGGSPWDHCETCYGAGKLDWIERIVGKPEPYQGSSSTSSCSSSVVTPSIGVGPFEKNLEQYQKELIRRSNYEHKNFIGSRTVQRFRKMFNKSKRSM